MPSTPHAPPAIQAPFMLRQVVREVLRDSTLADPGAVAVEVLRRIPPAKVKAALEQTLRLYVRQVISEERISAPPATPASAPNASWKVTGVRDGWQKRLRDRVHVGAGRWKFLADCTATDLAAAAAERRDLAERNLAWATTYDTWAHLLTEHGARTFGELPTDALVAALGRAA